MGLCSAGVDWIVASIFRKPHILLVEQFTTHQKINPDEITWNEFNAKPYIGAGIVVLVIGALSIVATVFVI